MANGDHITVGTAAITVTQVNSGGNQKSVNFAEVRTDQDAFVKGETYVIHNVGTAGVATGTAGSDAYFIAAAATNADATSTAITGNLLNGQKITIKENATDGQMAALNSLIEGITFTKASDTLTSDIEAVQAKINTARVQAGSQYAALESAVAYTTDLTAQYELGYNTVNDVNFSMETAHLAKNQILQQAATAMLAQANSGQQSLLQLIQG
jgi:flagellin